MLVRKFRNKNYQGYQKPLSYRDMELYHQFYEMNNSQYDLLGGGFYFAPNYSTIGKDRIMTEQIDDTKIQEQGGSGLPEVLNTTYQIITGSKKAYDYYISEQGTQLKNFYGSYINKHPNWRPGFAGEMHLPSSSGIIYNYMGPKTRLRKRIRRGDPPIDEIDQVAMTHDIAYSNSKTWRDVRKADKKFISGIKKAKGSKITKTIVNSVMRAKIKAEDLGLMKKGSFSSINNAIQDVPIQLEQLKHDPLTRLKKTYR